MSDQSIPIFCSRCKSSKPSTEFEKNRTTKTGYSWYCKTCLSIYRKSRPKRNRREYMREYLKTYAPIRNARRSKRTRDEKYGEWKSYKQRYPDQIRERRRQRWLKERFKQRANQAIYRAVKTGKIDRSPFCQICFVVTKCEAHHYINHETEHYFDIVWLCPSCHAFLRRKYF